MIKILFVGSSKYPMYANAFYEAALKMNDVEATLFDTEIYSRKDTFYRIEQNLAWGYSVRKINNRLIFEIENNEYDMVFLYSVRVITGNTVKYIKDKGIYVATYSNDNPFSHAFRNYYWRHFKEQIRYADITYVYRKKNLKDALKYGANRVGILMSYYIKSRNYPINSDAQLIECPSVLFLGHREHDERETYIKNLLDNKISVGVPDYEWKGFEDDHPYLIKLKETHKNYNKYLNSCEIALVFLSSINQDTYTRRCFEIPATKKMMLAPATEDILSLFVEDKEIVVYRNTNDFIDKIKYYLANEKARIAIANEGYKRIIKDGHEVADRVNTILEDFKENNKENNINV